jgi:hypothetical protein
LQSNSSNIPIVTAAILLIIVKNGLLNVKPHSDY